MVLSGTAAHIHADCRNRAALQLQAWFLCCAQLWKSQIGPIPVQIVKQHARKTGCFREILVLFLFISVLYIFFHHRVSTGLCASWFVHLWDYYVFFVSMQIICILLQGRHPHLIKSVPTFMVNFHVSLWEPWGPVSFHVLLLSSGYPKNLLKGELVIIWLWPNCFGFLRWGFKSDVLHIFWNEALIRITKWQMLFFFRLMNEWGGSKFIWSCELQIIWCWKWTLK